MTCILYPLCKNPCNIICHQQRSDCTFSPAAPCQLTVLPTRGSSHHRCAHPHYFIPVTFHQNKRWYITITLALAYYMHSKKGQILFYSCRSHEQQKEPCLLWTLQMKSTLNQIVTRTLDWLWMSDVAKRGAAPLAVQSVLPFCTHKVFTWAFIPKLL